MLNDGTAFAELVADLVVQHLTAEANRISEAQTGVTTEAALQLAAARAAALRLHVSAAQGAHRSYRRLRRVPAHAGPPANAGGTSPAVTAERWARLHRMHAASTAVLRAAAGTYSHL